MTQQSPVIEAVELSALEAAGLVLDAAIARFELAGHRLMIAAYEDTAADCEFGDADDAVNAAQSNYRNALREVTGADPAVILQRLMR